MFCPPEGGAACGGSGTGLCPAPPGAAARDDAAGGGGSSGGSGGSAEAPPPTVLVGHSMGGAVAVWAASLKGEGAAQLTRCWSWAAPASAASCPPLRRMPLPADPCGPMGLLSLPVPLSLGLWSLVPPREHPSAAPCPPAAPTCRTLIPPCPPAAPTRRTLIPPHPPAAPTCRTLIPPCPPTHAGPWACCLLPLPAASASEALVPPREHSRPPPEPCSSHARASLHQLPSQPGPRAARPVAAPPTCCNLMPQPCLHGLLHRRAAHPRRGGGD